MDGAHRGAVRRAFGQEGTKPTNAEWANYVRAYHTTALQLGEPAARARPKLLIVYHNGRRVTADRILADIRRSFSGPVVIAADLQRF
jgi:ribonuclease BN (tRNA processing enzyme)